MDAAEKLLERMRRTKEGWGQKDFETLYLGFGFEYREGRDRVYIHRKYRHLRAIVARHNQLATGYATTAVRLIDELKRLEVEDERRSEKTE